MLTALTLLMLQAVLGGADILWFHEHKLKLYLKPSSIKELRLHASRDFIYAVLFVSLAWWSWHGELALFIGVLLLAEIVITLVDFIEEDRTRNVPAGERTMHAVMGMIYGGFVAYLFPQLVLWFERPSGLTSQNYPWLTVLLTAMAMGVFVSGVRDLIASRLLARSIDQ